MPPRTRSVCRVIEMCVKRKKIVEAPTHVTEYGKGGAWGAHAGARSRARRRPAPPIAVMFTEQLPWASPPGRSPTPEALTKDLQCQMVPKDGRGGGCVCWLGGALPSAPLCAQHSAGNLDASAHIQAKPMSSSDARAGRHLHAAGRGFQQNSLYLPVHHAGPQTPKTCCQQVLLTTSTRTGINSSSQQSSTGQALCLGPATLGRSRHCTGCPV
jgi:hypothetical protein